MQDAGCRIQDENKKGGAGCLPVLKAVSFSRSEIVHRASCVLHHLAILTFLATSFLVMPAEAARIKELGYVNGFRPNQLIGYGLVVGLKGTGDKQTTIFTNQALANMLDRMGIRIDPTSTKVTNVASVVVTANLPPYAKVGNRIDATVSSIGDAKSIEGGILVLTPLKGVDGEVYAVAQGPMVVGGYLISGQGASVQKNHPTVGRVPNGVTIEKEITYEDLKADTLMISLKIPDYTTARRMAERINDTFKDSASAKDAGTVSISVPDDLKPDPVKFVSILENLDIKPDMLGKIVVDEKNGTVVIGENVIISTVAISHGNISVQVKEDTKVSQPMPYSKGQTVVTPDTKIKVEEEKGKFVVMEGGVSIKELVSALNAIGVSSRDVIAILQTIKAAGALHAELEVI